MSRIQVHWTWPLGAAILIAMASAMQAQGVPPCSPPPVQGGGPTVVAGVKNAPFSATGEQTFDQKLPGGNALHGVVLSRMARDSAGRTRVETLRRCWHGQDGNIHAAWDVVVNDGVAGNSLTWIIEDQASKVVRVTSIRAPTPEESARSMREEALFQPPQRELQIENLGTKEINGVSAEGKRTTREIPAGEEGNDLPMTTVDEVWNSKQLQQKVMTINDSPRGGRFVFELEEVKLQEPDASLFTAPVGYTVQEIKPASQGR
jgi:hypothetical protein